jgi:DNA-binding transcriptional regulator YiaG
MPNIATAFRQEITRLARREVRSEAGKLRKASAKFRKDIARLKRTAADLLSEIARLRRSPGQAPAREADVAKTRFTARGVIAHRRRLRLSAADYGKLVGVTGHTVYAWEHGASRPRNAQRAALAAVRSMGRREALARLETARGRRPAARRKTK